MFVLDKHLEMKIDISQNTTLMLMSIFSDLLEIVYIYILSYSAIINCNKQLEYWKHYDRVIYSDSTSNVYIADS